MALVEGPAGSGKSALLAAVAGPSANGPRVLRAGGAELEREYAFGAIRQLFEPLLADESRRAELLRGVAAPVAWLVDPEGDSDSLATRPQAAPAVLHGVHALIARVAAAEPLLIAVDDLHWLDEPSLLALHFVARRLTDLPVAVVGTMRPSEPDAPALLDDLRALGGLRIALPPLSSRAVATLVREQVPGAGDELCSVYHRASGGNPLYVRELLLWARGEGLGAEPEAAAAVARASVPALGERLLRRVDRVAPEARTLAAAMSVLGDERPLRDAAALAEIDGSEAARIARGLTDIELLARDDPFAFMHPLLRRSVYDRLSATERQALHSGAATQLQAQGASAETIATHVRELPPAASTDAVAALREAAAAAMARAAPDLAIPLLHRALAEGAVDPGRAVLLLELGRAESYTRDPQGIAHLEEAFDLAAGDPHLRARVAVLLTDFLSAAGRWADCLEVLTTAVTELDGRDPELTVELEALRAATMAHDPHFAADFDRERDRFDELSRGESWSALALAALLAAVTAFRCEPPEAVRALADRALRGGRLLGERGGGGWAVGQVIPALVLIEEHDRALELSDEVLARGRAAGSLFGATAGVASRGFVHCRRGDLVAAEADLREAHAMLAASGIAMWLTSVMHFFCDAILERPSLDDIAEMVEAMELEPAFQTTAGGVMLLETRGRLAMARGEPQRAVEGLEVCLATSRQLKAGPSFTWCRSTLALALPPDQGERAAALAAEELELARHAGIPRGVGVALRAAGLLAGGDEGVGLLREAAATLEGSPARLEYARSLVELGAALRRQRKRGEARAHLAEGMDLAFRCGADRLVARADEELHAAGARPRRAARSGAGALTSSELRVARLAAAGQSNIAIARALYLSPKTIETHLIKSYRKLGLSGRAARSGLADELSALDGEPNTDGALAQGAAARPEP
jgi:DNA-binding CsgD family transcriptional regulator